MNGKRKADSFILVLSVMVLAFGYGELTVRSQTGPGATVTPTPTPTPTSTRTPNPTPIMQLRLSANSGPQNGGNHVTIRGGRFNEQTKVNFGNQPAEIVKPVEASRITVIVPSRPTAGLVDVTVSTPGNRLLRAPYRYKALQVSPVPANAPLGIRQIEPSTGIPNKDNSLTIYGQGFNHETYVQIEGRSFVPEFIDAGHLKVFIPSGSYGPGPVDVEVRNRKSENMFGMPNGFTFTGPKIFWIDPGRGVATGGPLVRIHGRYLKYRNLADVLFGDRAITEGHPDQDDEHTIYVKPPPHKPGWVDVVIYNGLGQKTVLNNGYYYYDEAKDDAIGSQKTPKIQFFLIDIDVREHGGAGSGTDWSFDIFVNNKRLCELPSRMYTLGPPQGPDANRVNCRREIELEDNEIRVRIIGMRGDFWMEGETTVSVGAADAAPIFTRVRANSEKKGNMVFVFGAEKRN